ncbi:MAG: right-handed parallel beta-helix repeat-containing protein [Prolixibacteraceae bacterium]
MTSVSPTKRGYQITFLLFAFAVIFSATQAQNRDGKILQGEKWQKFIAGNSKADFYVSPTGNDQWSGTLPESNAAKTDGPFATILQAQKAVKILKSKVYFPKDPPVEKRWIGSPHPLGRGKDILVYIREGHYYLNQPLQFEPADGGERVETNLPTGAFEYHKIKDHYVTYAAYPGEKPVISGGLPVTAWKQKKGVWTAQLIADSVSMFLIDGKKQTLARKPNTGYFIPTSVSKKTDELTFSKGDLEPWKDLAGNRVVMLLRWHTGINSFSRIDSKTGTAFLKAPQEGIVVVPPRYYVENLKSLLDTAGEWYFDKNAKELSYISPRETGDPNQASASIAKLNKLVVVVGEKGHPVRNLRFYGLIFEGLEAGNSAISFEYAHACELAESTIRSCAGTGVYVKAGCYQTRIQGNSIESIDNGGIYVIGSLKPVWQSEVDYNKGVTTGTGGESSKIIRETVISHNRVSDCGGNSIYASNSLSTTISHNYITKTRGRYGIDVGDWSNQEDALDGNYLVEYNHLDDVQQDADDSGAIKTAGMVFNSVVRRNLIHRVHAGFFNDNVGFWFDNMSQGWVTEENIYYDLEQGEMKYCAAQPEDNTYRNNFKIEKPIYEPEIFLEGEPDFRYSKLNIVPSGQPSGSYPAGSVIQLSAEVFNNGTSGISPVEMYLDGKIYEKKLFPVITKNSQIINFQLRIYDAGEHLLSIGTTPHQKINIEGSKPPVVFENFKLSSERCLEGEKISLQATAKNLTSQNQKLTTAVYLDDHTQQETRLELNADELRDIHLDLQIPAGTHTVRIGNSAAATILVQPKNSLDISQMKILEYGSPRAKPFTIEADPQHNRYKISACGSDFYHAEDSYAAAYLKGIKGDFVVAVKINQFGERTHEWFRSGIFVRNDIAKSFDVQPGSKGSVLLFGTPGRAGIQYDEFANGCMHKASSQNLPEHSKTPIYLKLVRHGNSFSGYVSLDGIKWIIEKQSTDIPSLNESVDIGLAAGGPDARQYWVEFTDWKIEVAQ